MPAYRKSPRLRKSSLLSQSSPDTSAQGDMAALIAAFDLEDREWLVEIGYPRVLDEMERIWRDGSIRGRSI